MDWQNIGWQIYCRNKWILKELMDWQNIGWKYFVEINEFWKNWYIKGQLNGKRTSEHNYRYTINKEICVTYLFWYFTFAPRVALQNILI